jgi:hypothetical protein
MLKQGVIEASIYIRIYGPYALSEKKGMHRLKLLTRSGDRYG